jgi:hypothetical protein
MGWNDFRLAARFAWSGGGFIQTGLSGYELERFAPTPPHPILIGLDAPIWVVCTIGLRMEWGLLVCSCEVNLFDCD